MKIEETDSHLLNLIVHQNLSGEFEVTCLLNPSVSRGGDLPNLTRFILDSDIKSKIVESLLDASEKENPGSASIITGMIGERSVLIKPIMGLDYVKGINFQMASFQDEGEGE